MYNFENLPTTDDKIYDLCKNTLDRLEGLHVENEDIIEDLTKLIKQKCDPIAKKYEYKYMDDL
jgi:hypothetical protein